MIAGMSSGATTTPTTNDSAPPKSGAGKRLVVTPAAIVPVIREHLGHLNDAEGDSLIFTSPEG